MEKFLGQYQIFLLILVRMMGFLFFNSILGKKNLPSIVKVGMAGMFSFVIFLNFKDIMPSSFDNLVEFGFAIILEFSFGFLMSFIIEIFLSALLFGGEIFDMQMGLSMNKFYDPSSGTEVSVTGAFIRMMFMFIFFSTNSHITLLKIVFSSYSNTPVGKLLLNGKMLSFIILLFKDTFVLGFKIAIPILAAILIMDIGIGILMRAIPQLNVFTLNIYIKFIVGFMILLKISPDLAEFSEKLINNMFVNIEKLFKLISQKVA